MIDSIRIRNIQSHKDTELNLHPGVNVIIGSSNNGKTAVLRALYWSIYNRPLGIDNLCSHWALDDKGNIKEEMSVEVRKGENVLVRRKTKNVNQYVLNGNELNAIKTDVPPEVKNFYKLNETNIQRQQDAPFLVSSSSSEVARYFNGIARLDVIDSVLSYAEQTKRKERSSIEDVEKRIEEQDKLHESFAWTEKVGELLDKIDRLIEKEESLEKERTSLIENLVKYEKYSKEIEELSIVNKGEEYIKVFEKNQEKQELLITDINKMKNDFKQYDKHMEIISMKLPATKWASCETITHELEQTETEWNNLKADLYNFATYSNTIESCNNKIEEYKAMLPEICPLCGNPMKEEI